jgi:hypothetical protein
MAELAVITSISSICSPSTTGDTWTKDGPVPGWPFLERFQEIRRFSRREMALAKTLIWPLKLHDRRGDDLSSTDCEARPCAIAIVLQA